MALRRCRSSHVRTAAAAAATAAAAAAAGAASARMRAECGQEQGGSEGAAQQRRGHDRRKCTASQTPCCEYCCSTVDFPMSLGRKNLLKQFVFYFLFFTRGMNHEKVMLHWALFVCERTNKSIIIKHSHHAPQATFGALIRNRTSSATAPSRLMQGRLVPRVHCALRAYEA